MQVKRLEITGFKSFADRTILDFSQGLCAVVGPNGCGKSNVVDAVRWVLGEQSAKTLRGHSMEDVIFNGSSGRQGTSLAEVSLVFDNQDTVAASQFADLPEIMVTRRLYRNGDSDYFINKMPCRLKDIQQLLMDTGLGNRAYAIIEQGKVSAFIEAKPEDRRLWVEEAAGITRFKNQRKVSQRKMDQAQDNMNRLQDILHEIAAQMEKLKRQSKKALVHKDLVTRIRELDLAIASHEYARLEELGTEARSEGEALGAQSLLANQRVTGLETDLETLRINLVSAEQEIAQAGERRLAAQGAIQKAENELTLLGREAESQRRLAARYAEERQDLQTRLASQERDLARASRLTSESAARQETAQAQVDQAVTLVRSRQQDVGDLEAGHDAAKHALVDHLSSITQIKNRLADLERQSAELERRQEQLAQRREGLESSLAAHQEKLALAEDNLARMQEALKSVDGRLTELSRERQESQQMLSALRRGEQDATRTRHQLEAKTQAMTSALASYDWAQAGVRKLVQEGAAGRLGVDVLGVVAEKLTVSPGKEALAEAVLGANLQALMVKDGIAARALAAKAAELNLGRLRLVSLEDLRAQSPALPVGSKPMNGHLRPEPGFEALTALWSGVGCCESLDGAWGLGQEMTPGVVLVTDLGERLDRPGAATVGKGQAQSILTRMNELKRLQGELKAAEATLVEATDARAAAEEALAVLEAEHQELRGSRSEQERALRQAEQDLFRAREASAVSERQMEALEYDAEEIHGRLYELRNQAESLEVDAEQSQANTSSLEAGLTQAQEALAQTRTALEEARKAEGETRVAAASALAEAEQASRESTRLEREIAQARQRLLALAADLQAAQDQVESLTRRRQEEQDRLAGLYEEMDRQETAYRQARELHAQAQMRAGDLEADLKRARAEQRQVENEIQEITLRQREIALQRENLCQQIMERCRVDLVSDHQAHMPEGPFDPETSRERLSKLRQRLNRLGPVNMEAINEFEALQEREQFLAGQKADLEASLDDLKQAIKKINKTSRARFNETLEQVNQRLTAVFPVLFGGGHAQLALDEGVDPLEAGLHIMVELPGKKVKNLEALSGGEKALSAVAVLFALFLIRPAPFCILDEVDAPLDEANVGRFHDLLRQLSARSQIMMITHNRRTMEIMDQLYGVTMEEKGVSKLLSVSLEQGRAQAA